MLKLSKKAEYALISLQHISSLGADELASAREIAEQYHIPPEILGKVLQALTRAEIVESLQGARGGYRLKRGLGETTLGEVIEAVDGPVHIAPCTGDHYNCQQEAACNIKQPINQLQHELQRFVYGMSLESLAKQPGGDVRMAVSAFNQGVDYVLFKKEE